MNLTYYTKPLNSLYFLIFVLLLINHQKSYSQNIENISEQKPIKLTGGFSASFSLYNTSDSIARRSPFSYTLAGNPTVVLYGITFPFSFVYMDEQSSFSQPFNQFGVSPYYKWLKLHLGYRSVNFSPFTLAGHTFLGAGVELNPGILRFGAIYGRFQKAIPLDTTSVNNSTLYSSPIPAYKRTGYAIKLGLGTEKNYVDLIYMKGIDDSTSISELPGDYDLYAGENTVLGISHKFTIAKKITWKSDIGISLYTMDLNAGEFDSEDFPLYDVIKNIIKLNNSSQLLTAGETSLSYKEKYFSLLLKYRRVDPDYKSMGTYYFQTDVEQYTVAPAFIFFKYKLMINSSFGYQRDNLYDRKSSTSERKIGSFNINYNASQKFGMNFQYSNYGVTQNPALAKIMADTSYHRYDSLRISQVSQNIGFSPRLNFTTELFSHAFNLYVGYQKLDDNNKNTQVYSNMKSINANLNYTLFSLKSNLTFSPSIIYNSSKTYSGTLENIGGTINISNPFWNNTLFGNTSLSYTSNYFDSSNNGYTFNFILNLSVKPFKSDKQSFNINLLYMKNRAQDETLTRDFNEFTGTFGYNVNF